MAGRSRRCRRADPPGGPREPHRDGGLGELRRARSTTWVQMSSGFTCEDATTIPDSTETFPQVWKSGGKGAGGPGPSGAAPRGGSGADYSTGIFHTGGDGAPPPCSCRSFSLLAGLASASFDIRRCRWPAGTRCGASMRPLSGLAGHAYTGARSAVAGSPFRRTSTATEPRNRHVQAHIPAEHPPQGQEARVPSPDADPCGPCDPLAPPREGPRPPRRLTCSRSCDLGRSVLCSIDGRTFHGDRVVAFLAPGSGSVAFVAGRRVGGAVQRNRSRRILRAAWRQVAPGVADGFDIAWVARQSILGAKTQELVGEMTELLRGARSDAPVNVISSRPVDVGAPARRSCSASSSSINDTLSGMLGGQCRFVPSCSHYAEEAIRSHGAIRGAATGLWRIMRCGPFTSRRRRSGTARRASTSRV